MANEKRLIDAFALVIKASAKLQALLPIRHDDATEIYNKMLSCIAEAPTVDAVEVVHGRWIYKDDTVMKWTTKAICSVCDCKVAHNSELAFDYGVENFKKLHKYCPNCGAKMDGDGNEHK